MELRHLRYFTRLFFTLICCLAIPLVARAADQGNNKKKKHATQGQEQQQQTGKPGKHHGANTVSRPNNRSQAKGQSHHRGSNARNNNVADLQPKTKGKVESKRSNFSDTRSQAKGRGHHRGLKARNNDVADVQSNTKGKAETKRSNVSNNQPRAKGRGHHRGLKASSSNVAAARSNAKGKVHARHFDLAKSSDSRIESAKFHKNYRIHGNENWKGKKYVVFQNYRGEWHNRGWWHNHHNRIVLISGGWYFFNSGYWAPAWGYDPAVAYYPYNGPIYAYNNLPPDQVIANVQSALQANGYYRGEVDGLLGPLTRAALSSYQRNNGLYMTSAIDEPTLDSLGMS